MTPPNKHDPEPLLLDHEADGIKELDNNLPTWWIWLFYGCIAYAGAYLGYYHVLALGDTPLVAYAKEVAAGEKLKMEAQSTFERTLETLKPSNDSSQMAQGAKVYTTYCAPCHRADGGGLVGPNLCDDYWIHGSNYVDSVKIILTGAPDKGMLTWRGVLTPTDIESVANYIYAFRGTQPPNPKPREDLVPTITPGEFE